MANAQWSVAKCVVWQWTSMVSTISHSGWYFLLKNFNYVGESIGWPKLETNIEYSHLNFWFAGYNPMERPVENATEALVVNIKFYLQQVFN